MAVSDEFRSSFLGGGSYISQECMCGRVHFCSPQIPDGDFEDGEYERLKKLQGERPEKYIESEYDCISYFDFGDNTIVWDCPCGNDMWVEKVVWGTRKSIMDYYRNRLDIMEKKYWEMAGDVHSVDIDKFDSNDKFTYEEFINKMREFKTKKILE